MTQRALEQMWAALQPTLMGGIEKRRKHELEQLKLAFFSGAHSALDLALAKVHEQGQPDSVALLLEEVSSFFREDEAVLEH